MSKELSIIWHGHSCFEINSEDAVIILDPYEEVPGYRPLELAADLVLASHEHSDHNARSRVKLSGREAAVDVEIIDTFHDPDRGSLRGKNKIHIITVAGKRIAHCGDLGHALEQDQLARLQNLDLLLIPVGGYYTIDADTAAEIVRACKPDLAVPMHYREGQAGFDLISTVQAFLDHFDTVVRHDQSSFTLGEFHDTILVLKNPKL
ncbi:MAG: MBL fold metallo-hydrolase [Clostridiaceae bacterium]|jgi:L-ascorbate metabolism protein UlaG (beta-lactamase superfamily)|nr:MBL fold metallo-hydrolase [Clostridiaceae bacterium]